MNGSCLCGSVTYNVAEDLELKLACHCHHCQKQTGSAFSLLYGAPRGSVAIQGQIQTYQDRGDSGKPVHRMFCPRCGSCVAVEADVLPHITFVFGGTLDNQPLQHPDRQIFCRSAEPWVTVQATESFQTMPSAPN